jgi:hypothetical protein
MPCYLRKPDRTQVDYRLRPGAVAVSIVVCDTLPHQQLRCAQLNPG